MHYAYILRLRDGSYYIGSTSNLETRLIEHKRGRVRSTKGKLPAALMFKEGYESRSEAQTREYQIKKWKSRSAIERLLKK